MAQYSADEGRMTAWHVAHRKLDDLFLNTMS